MDALILTNSFDGSSDFISQILSKKKINFIRWNIDLWSEYEISISQNFFSITDPTGKTIELSPSLKILWRKPITEYFSENRNVKLSADNLKFAKSQIKIILQSIMALSRDNGAHFIDPIDDIRLPKLKQLEIAKKYFDILPYEFSILKKKETLKNSITKPLGNAEVGKKILYASKLDQDKAFRPFPWFFQEGILEGQDVTCVYIKGEVFFYFCEYKRSSAAIDWRIEINKKDAAKWNFIDNKHTRSIGKKVIKLMKEFKLNYGRLDFIEKNNTYYFLECNGNGQFGWLDDFKKLPLHNKFVDAFLNQ